VLDGGLGLLSASVRAFRSGDSTITGLRRG
jgi:hypothetical protein